MVSRGPVKHLRRGVPFLGFLALLVLFLKLPETPDVFGVFGCKTCSTADPYLPLLGAGYFALLIGLSMLFPAFPGHTLARAGLVWAVSLAVALTWIALPGWCLACLVAHACNLAIWGIWMVLPEEPAGSQGAPMRERLCLAVFAPLSVVALFSGLNLTFMAYGYRLHALDTGTTSLQPGDRVPAFETRTWKGVSFSDVDATRFSATVLNFVSPDCHYCKEQLPVLDTIASELADGQYRFVNISASVTPDLAAHSPNTEWVEDSDSALRRLFQVTGYPTLFLLNSDGKIKHVVSGVPTQLRAMLIGSLVE